jgi:hypothetical protein
LIPQHLQSPPLTMGALFSSLFSRCITPTRSLSSRWSHPSHRGARDSDATIREHLSDDVEGGLREDKVDLEANSATPTPKRRVLLVGISYHNSSSETWTPLDGPHADIKHFRKLLINTYGYSREDITVLKDDPDLPDTSQPTRANMVIELYSLFFRAVGADAYDSFVNSKHLLPVPHQATSSYFSVRASFPPLASQPNQLTIWGPTRLRPL